MTDRFSADSLVAAFARRAAPAADPDWLGDRRRSALAAFAERGLPTPRDEEWKYTSLSPLAGMAIDLTANGAGRPLTAAAIAPFLMGPPSWTRLVFLNGRYVAALSSVGSLPGGVRMGSLAAALTSDEETVMAPLAGVPAEREGPFAALNAAFWADGAFVHVPAGVSLAEPVQLLFVASAPDRARADHPRNLIVLERESRATMVESYVALTADAYLTNAVTELVVSPGADVDHLKVTLESPRAFHVGRTDLRQERGSRVNSCSVVFGGRLVRNDVSARLDGEGADCRLSGLSVQSGDQHLDTATFVDHRSPRAVSRQLYKGVLDGRARGVFSGRVVVRPGANGTDAHQTNKNLLLSDGVEVDSKPQLEIFADDVKCSHGAADGQLAGDAIFYLKSRGLDEPAARTLLTRAFASEVLDRLPVEPIRVWCDHLLATRLREGRVIEEGV